MNNYTDNFSYYDTFLPPEDVVSSVNPFSKAFYSILIGLALWIIKLNFLYLNYLLPLIGLMLLFTGFRVLRNENKWFLSCFIITAFHLFEFSMSIIVNTTIYHKEIYQSPFMTLLPFISIILSFLLFIFLGNGIKTIQKKSNLPEAAGGTVALIVWYAVLCALALLKYNGIIIGVIMLIAFIFIIISLYDISSTLNEAGYTLSPPAFKIPNWLICSAICLAIAAGGICGYMFLGKYNMNWEEFDDSHSQSVKAHLEKLGFPKEVLNDISEDDLSDCKDALIVNVETALHPVNNGREVIEKRVDASGRIVNTHYRVYDQKELIVTSVAIKLPKERETWKFFHHFTWQITPTFYGTECLRIIPAYSYGSNLGWSNGGKLSGRLLYDSGSATYTAPYTSLGTYTHTADDMFFGQSTSEDIYATFSFPQGGTSHRGYVCYTTVANQPGWMLSSWLNYTHRATILEYPNQTAFDNTLKSILDKSDAYISVQDAIQFRP